MDITIFHFQLVILSWLSFSCVCSPGYHFNFSHFSFGYRFSLLCKPAIIALIHGNVLKATSSQSMLLENNLAWKHQQQLSLIRAQLQVLKLVPPFSWRVKATLTTNEPALGLNLTCNQLVQPVQHVIHNQLAQIDGLEWSYRFSLV